MVKHLKTTTEADGYPYYYYTAENETEARSFLESCKIEGPGIYYIVEFPTKNNQKDHLYRNYARISKMMVCKVCKKEFPFHTFGGICSPKCEKELEQLNLSLFNKDLYQFISKRTSELGLTNYGSVKEQILKVVKDLGFSW